ncbi:MAG: arylsulfatase [Verrucomicrobiales bacterium]|nr:arylsulfatase [Verrucomicrobiales bacterium]
MPWLVLFFLGTGFSARAASAGSRPNVVLIYADDIGYGDLGCYGAHRVSTPNVDGLAREGLRFLDAHSPAATCTPSRYALLTGEYAWRRKGTGVLPGDAALVMDPARLTLPALLRRAGYRTAMVGKWHLGMGPGPGRTDWNGEIRPGPMEVGFDESFVIPATGDRVPCVYVEGHRVLKLDPADALRVSFAAPLDDSPTGRSHPELLTMRPSHGHDMSIIAGISRIGYMTGGKTARWSDADMSDVLVERARQFLKRSRSGPFFLSFNTHDVHVPRVPHARFAGRSGMGPRGDCLVQFDDAVGALLAELDASGVRSNTLVILSSDNGPVVDDGYRDDAVEKLGDHRPAGPWRGGKYSNFEGGTRVPFIVSWPGRVTPGESSALLSQVDLLASMASLTGQALVGEEGPDSQNVLPALLGESRTGRESLVEQAGVLSLRRGPWKYIEPGQGAKYNLPTRTELGNDPEGQLYRLDTDPGETRNLRTEEPERFRDLAAELARIRTAGRSRP